MMGNKKIFVSLGMILLLVIVTIGVTFAAFTFTKEGQVENTLETSTIMLTYTEGKTGIMLNEAYPMSDEKGKVLVGENNVFDFTVQATLGKSNVISYEVSAVKIPISDMASLENDEVKLYLEKAVDPDTTYQEVLAPSNFIPIDAQTVIGSPIDSMVLDEGIFINEGTTIHNYRLRMWVDENTQIPNGESRKYGVKINVYAKTTPSTEESCFTFNEKNASITGYSDTCPKDVKIPSIINGVQVTTIGANAFKDKGLTSATIPLGITNIGSYAFQNNQLSSITIPDTVVSMGSSVFKSNQLTSAKLSKEITEIGTRLFEENQLTEITIPSKVTTIGSLAFKNN